MCSIKSYSTCKNANRIYGYAYLGANNKKPVVYRLGCK